MINKRFTVAAADLTTGNDIIIIDIPIQVSDKSLVGTAMTVTLYPREFQIINDTGAEVQINFLRSIPEQRDYTSNPDRYAPIRIPNDCILQDQFSVDNIISIVARGVAGKTYTKDLIIEMLKYAK